MQSDIMPCGCGSKADIQSSSPTTSSGMEINTTSDFFKPDKRTIDTQKVIFSMWKYRANPSHIANTIQNFSKFIDEKRVYNEIEFYLPQLAHIIVHLDTSTPANVSALENLALLLAKTSIHTAQQLTFILVAALQDYQPENADGRRNPNANFNRYSRCAGLLKRIERVVVIGDLSPPEAEYKQSGFLKFKRVVRKGPLRTKGWKRRFFSVQNSILGCYRNADDKEPIRAMLLPGCTIETEPASFNHPYTFSVYHKTSYIQFNLRAADENEFKMWVVFLKNAIDPSTVEVVESPRDDSKSPLTPRTKGEVNRENFFHQQQLFVNNLTEISERLRFQDRDVRKYFLRRDMSTLVIPPFCYLPLCTSLTPFRCILRALPMESHAFSTKARCPALMLFEVEEHPAGTDTATFLGAELQHYDELTIHEVGAQSFVSYDESDLQFNPAADDVMPPLHLAAKESRFNRLIAQTSHGTGSSFWVEEGTGMRRLKDSAPAAGTTSLNAPSNTHNVTQDTIARLDTLELGIAAANDEAPGSGFTELNGVRPRVESVATSHPMDLRSSFTSHSHTLGGGTLTNVDDQNEVKRGPLLNKETYELKAVRLRHQSPYRDLPNWKIVGLIAKSNDDVRQEVFVMQLITYYQMAFKNEKIPVYLHTYRILSTSKTTGLIQLIPDAVSLDGLKKEPTYPGSLRGYFELTYGAPGGPKGDQEPPELTTAISEYVKSLAGYSIVTYLLAIKDRHNGNIMIDTLGHLVHIDFGFVFGLAPGKAFSMEKAPFKLTEEMVGVMGGTESKHYNKYVDLCVDTFRAARKHQRVVIRLMEIMSYCSNYPSFKYNKNAIQDFRRRLMLHVPDEKIAVEVKKLVSMSYKHTGTVLYDRFQLATNGIAM